MRPAELEEPIMKMRNAPLRAAVLLAPLLFSLACAVLDTPTPLAPTATFGLATVAPAQATPIPPSATPEPTSAPPPSATPATPSATPEPTEPGIVRIRFAEGATSAQVSGRLEPSGGHSYVLWAAAGQHMSVRLLPPPVGDPKAILVIWGEDGVPLVTDHALTTEWEGDLIVSQDYFIDVRANPSTSVEYTLEVVIPPPSG